MISRNDVELERARSAMVQRDIAARGIRDERVLAAMERIPREAFVSVEFRTSAYDDAPLPIDEGQTISQPYIVALMIEALRLEPSDRVLEIGTGSGYAAAVLAELAGEVYTIERHPSLAHSARERLRRFSRGRVHVGCGDGSRGWPDAAPFDAIVVAAGGPAVPESLREQLAVGGRLVMPVGEVVGVQHLLRVTREDEARYRTERLCAVHFVPLIGAEGWAETESPSPDRRRPH